jgi:hypothetical protein
MKFPIKNTFIGASKGDAFSSRKSQSLCPFSRRRNMLDFKRLGQNIGFGKRDKN